MVMQFILDWIGQQQTSLPLSEANAPDGRLAETLRAIEAAEPGSVSPTLEATRGHMFILGQQLETNEETIARGIVHVQSVGAYAEGMLDSLDAELADMKAAVDDVRLR